MAKSKGRLLAEWLRNLNASSQATTNTIADDAITNAKIADDAIDTAQIADDAVHTANLADANVTFAKLHTALVVTESDAISSNDNDTTVPTSAAVVDYISTYIAGNQTYGNITTTGYIAGPSTFTIDPAAVGDNTGTLVVAGNLQVDGTTTTINSTTVNVDDLNIQLATGAANAAAADGAGITVDGPVVPAKITYNSTPDEWTFNKNVRINIGSSTTTINELSFANSYDTAFLRSSYTNPSSNTETYLAFHTNTIGAANGTVAEQMRIAGNKVGIGTGNTFTTGAKFEVNDSSSNSGFWVGSGTVVVTRQSGFPNIFWDDGTDNLGAIYYDKTNGMRIFSTDGSTGNPERLRINNSGQLIIQGNTDTSMSALANGQFQVSGNGYTGAIALDATAMYLYHNSASRDLILGTDETERLRITSGGNVGIGTGAPGYQLSVAEINSTASNRQTPVDVLEIQAQYAGGDGQPFGSAGGASFGSGLVFSNEKYTNSNITRSAAIYGLVSENSTATTGGGQLAFYTASTLDATLTEKMRILPNGNVGINEINPQEKLSVVGGILAASSSGSTSGITIESTATAGYVSTITHTDTGMEFDTGSILRPFKFDGAGTNLWTLYTNTGSIEQNYGVYRFAATTSGSDTGSQFQLWGTNGGPGYMAAYQLNFNTGGNNSRTTSMHIDSNGHIGIGTNSPYDTAWGVNSKQLAISGDTYGVLHLLGNYNSITTKYSIGAGGGNLYLAYDDVNGQHRITVDSDGKVGINTSTPAHLFSINTNSGKSIEFNWWTTGSSNYIQSYDRTNAVYLPLANFATDVIFHNGSSEIGRINGTGLAIGTGAAPDARLNISTPNFTSSATSGMIKWDNPNVSSHASIQGYYVASEGAELFIGTNSYINTAGTTVRWNNGYASSAIYPRRDGSVQLFAAGSGSNPTLRYILEGTDGSHKYYNGGVSNTPVARKYFYHQVTYSTGGYVHMKTNISWASHTQMYSIHFEGQEYQASRAIDTTLSWYSYSPSNAAINVGSYGTHTASVYSSSDGYLVMVWYANSTTYYSAFTLSQRATAQGINTGFAVTNSTVTNSSTGAF